METLEELLKKKEKAEGELADLKKKLGHPHGDSQCVHDQAYQEFGVWSAYLEDIKIQIVEAKRTKWTKKKSPKSKEK